MPQTTQSPGLPSNTHHFVDGSSFCSLHKSFSGSFCFPLQSKKAIFGNLECSLPDSFSGVSLCQPKDSLSLCLCCPLLFTYFKPLSRAAQALFHKLFISFNIWVCPGVCTNYCSTYLVFGISASKAGTIITELDMQMLLLWELDMQVFLLWLGKIQRQLLVKWRVNIGKHSRH